MKKVGAAIIRKGKSILICRRKAGGSCALLWEFPGGKAEEGETIEQCLIRECEEELGIKIETDDMFAETIYEYEEGAFAFYFLNARIVSGTIKAKVHEEVCWVLPEDIMNYDFCPADVEVADRLNRDGGFAVTDRMTADSIIFDLDGTLWDATEIIVRSWNEGLREWGAENGVPTTEITEEQIKSVMGLQIKEIGEKLLPDLDEEAQRAVMARGCEIECNDLAKQGGLLYYGVAETLEVLSRRYELFIVSNCQCGYIEAFFAAHQLERYFRDFENPGRTGLTKGENIKLIVERNNLQKPVYVGDTAGDAKAAAIAEVPFIYARYGFGDVERFNYSIDSFPDILKVIEC